MISKVNKIRSSKNYRNKKFEKLTEYLKQAPDKITLNFKQLQKIIGLELPQSAFKYKAQWANGGHSHSHIWTDVGYKVIKPNPGISVTFTKIN